MASRHHLEHTFHDIEEESTFLPPEIEVILGELDRSSVYLDARTHRCDWKVGLDNLSN